MDVFRPKRHNNSRISGTIEIVDPPLSTEKWIQVASLVAQATGEEALKPILNGPYWSLAVSRWTEEEEYNDFLWRRVSFLSPPLRAPGNRSPRRRSGGSRRGSSRIIQGAWTRKNLPITARRTMGKEGKNLCPPVAAIPHVGVQPCDSRSQQCGDRDRESEEFYLGNLEKLKKELKKLHRICLHCDKYPSIIRRPLHEILMRGAESGLARRLPQN